MKRICSIDGEEVPYDQIAKGYESADGRLVILTDEDFAGLPLATGREIEVVEFVPVEQVDPILYGRTYYLEPESRAAKPYVLLREALETTQRLAVVRVAMRQRESLAVLRVRDRVIVLQTLMWPDEVRQAASTPRADVDLRPQELMMAQSLIESLASDFDPDQFEDEYAKALSELVDAKLEGAAPAPAAEVEGGASTEVVDLLTALQRSVDRARASRGEDPPAAPRRRPGEEGCVQDRVQDRGVQDRGVQDCDGQDRDGQDRGVQARAVQDRCRKGRGVQACCRKERGVEGRGQEARRQDGHGEEGGPKVRLMHICRFVTDGPFGNQVRQPSIGIGLLVGGT